MQDIEKIADAIRRAITPGNRSWDELDDPMRAKYVKAARKALIQNARNKIWGREEARTLSRGREGG